MAKLLFFVLFAALVAIAVLDPIPVAEEGAGDAGAGDERPGDEGYRYQGSDIRLTEEQYQALYGRAGRDNIKFGTYQGNKWPNRYIPYTIASNQYSEYIFRYLWLLTFANNFFQPLLN